MHPAAPMQHLGVDDQTGSSVLAVLLQPDGEPGEGSVKPRLCYAAHPFDLLHNTKP